MFIFDFSEPIFTRVYGDDEGEGEDGDHQGEDGGHQGEDGDHQGEDGGHNDHFRNFSILGFLTVTTMTIIISPTRREMTIKLK